MVANVIHDFPHFHFFQINRSLLLKNHFNYVSLRINVNSNDFAENTRILIQTHKNGDSLEILKILIKKSRNFDHSAVYNILHFLKRDH